MPVDMVHLSKLCPLTVMDRRISAQANPGILHCVPTTNRLIFQPTQYIYTVLRSRYFKILRG